MNLRGVYVGLGCIAAVAASASQGTEKERMDAIWGAAAFRMVEQGDVWFDKGEFPKIVQLLRIHNHLEPNNYEIATNLGWMLQNIEMNNEALSVYVRYKNLNPQDPDGPLPEANFYFFKKLYAKVPALLEPSLKKKPHPNSYRLLAHSYDRMNMLADSKRVWELYIKRFPNDDAAKNNLRRVEAKIKGNPR